MGNFSTAMMALNTMPRNASKSDFGSLETRVNYRVLMGKKSGIIQVENVIENILKKYCI